VDVVLLVASGLAALAASYLLGESVGSKSQYTPVQVETQVVEIPVHGDIKTELELEAARLRILELLEELNHDDRRTVR
jgi:hypothetical protein